MIATIDRRISRALAGIRKAFRGRGDSVDTTGPVMLIDGEGLKDEPIRGSELMQHYGITTVPPKGFMYVAIPVGGKTAHSVIVATEHGSYRIKGLKSGEVALYTDEGDSIILKRGHLIEFTTETLRVNASKAIEFNAPTITGNATGNVTFNTPLVSASKDIKAQGEICDHGSKSMSGMRDVFNDHDHQESGSTTNKPIQQM